MHNKIPAQTKNNESSTVLNPEVETVIKSLPPDKQRIIVQALSVRQQYSGPLPDGQTIKIYNDVIPNGGDRLMSTVEKQLEHRICIENTGIKRTFNQSSTGQWMAFFIAVFFGLISWDLAKSGHEVTSAILGTIDLVALVTVFITGKISKN